VTHSRISPSSSSSLQGASLACDINESTVQGTGAFIFNEGFDFSILKKVYYL
jgi:hypothetical protein